MYRLPVSVARRLLLLQEGWLHTFRVSDGASKLTKVTFSWTCPVATPVMVHKQEIFPGYGSGELGEEMLPLPRALMTPPQDPEVKLNTPCINYVTYMQHASLYISCTWYVHKLVGSDVSIL